VLSRSAHERLLRVLRRALFRRTSSAGRSGQRAWGVGSGQRDGQGAVEQRIGESVHTVVCLNGPWADDGRDDRDEQSRTSPALVQDGHDDSGVRNA